MYRCTADVLLVVLVVVNAEMYMKGFDELKVHVW